MVFRDKVEIPPTPPLPKYDPKDDPPKWSFSRAWWQEPVDKGEKEWTRIGDQPKSSSDPDWRGVIKDNVIVHEVPEPYKMGPVYDRNYFFFDTPDYADPFKKMWWACKWFAWTGLGLSCFRGLIESRKGTLENNIFLFRKVFAPWMLAGLSACSTVVVIANLRGKKDDVWNYAVPGLIFGTIIGGHRNYAAFFRYSILTPPVACYTKYNAEVNGNIWPAVSPRFLNLGLSGYSTEGGIRTGDLRFGFRGTWGDPGRDTRQ